MADDERDFIGIVRQWLVPSYDFIGMTAPKAFLRKLSEEEPDLVILDVKMRGASGFALCEEIRKKSRFAGLPIVFLTGCAEDMDFLNGWKMGGTKYLSKPVTRSKLLSVIRKYITLSSRQAAATY